jgi:glutaredoxin
MEWTRSTVPLLLTLLLASCRSSGRLVDAGAPEPPTPPELSLETDRKDLLFSYLDQDGKLRDVDSADKVPVDRRKQVLVRDLSKRAEEVKADQYVYVADLTREENGAWPYQVMSRYNIDRAVRDGDFVADEGADDGGEKRVTLYGTSWCGACAQARSWLRARGISFADKDVEKDPKAQAELARKVKRAGVPLGGVPVIDVGGKLLMGFDAKALERLLQAL